MIEAAALAFWGIVVHRVCDFLLQSAWMATHKAQRSLARSPWWDRHPAAFIHSGIHGLGFALLALLTPWPTWAISVIMVTHLVIDTRTPVVWWSRLMRQTEPEEAEVLTSDRKALVAPTAPEFLLRGVPNFSVGHWVRMQVDQVMHEVVICSLAVLLVVT